MKQVGVELTKIKWVVNLQLSCKLTQLYEVLKYIEQLINGHALNVRNGIN